jgi:hypothetical protein
VTRRWCRWQAEARAANLPLTPELIARLRERQQESMDRVFERFGRWFSFERTIGPALSFYQRTVLVHHCRNDPLRLSRAFGRAAKWHHVESVKMIRKQRLERTCLQNASPLNKVLSIMNSQTRSMRASNSNSNSKSKNVKQNAFDPSDLRPVPQLREMHATQEGRIERPRTR